jgi:Lon protease-like protein
LRNFYTVEYAERKKQQQEELKELSSSENEIPIFVCTLALPFAPCPLHIYEPRYRLMLRRAIESGSKQFGMCMYSDKTPYRFTEYGCMLEIRSHQFTRDGRAIVATIGGRRFKVLNSSTKDGYTVAQVEWVKDIRVENEKEKAGMFNFFRLNQHLGLDLDLILDFSAKENPKIFDFL